ncbi:RNA polymerase sigma factor [Leifsonia poae]|uniref:RNA polymerase sigma factor n=1 Tax=Leifsonia poae TaxID=110933 RepID=UPI003D66530E
MVSLQRTRTRFARRVTGTFEAADLVAEAFTRILSAIRGSGGPTGSFSGYLYSTIRNVSAKWARHVPVNVEPEQIADIAADIDIEQSTEDRLSVAAPFRSLPARWQEALWYTEVEGLKPAELAPLLGITASAAAMLASRARKGLREAWAAANPVNA